MTRLSRSGIHGGSIWSKIWSGLKSAWNPVIKPILSAAADQAATLGSAYVASTGRNPAVVGVLRQGLKKFTGVGVETKPSPMGRMVKGSQAAKDHMAKIRAMRKGGKTSKHGASFRLD
ncbi:hypothetical protein AM588_10000848 [Phytophthora nicotianae]|uniref:Uncharacterized protein n=1 Tax=Phytophthora nicotianae TaxID=4792 RepID=A0A0W8CMD1_PHYNI|nr:hypothetical protein AM588_10000848 [Phytophthora nicotianae]